MNIRALVIGGSLLIVSLVFLLGKGMNLLVRIHLVNENHAFKSSRLNVKIGIIIIAASLILIISGCNDVFMETYFTGVMIIWMMITGGSIYIISKKQNHGSANEESEG